MIVTTSHFLRVYCVQDILLSMLYECAHFSPQQPSKVFSSPFVEKTETRTVHSHPQHPQLSGGAATIAHFNQVLDLYRGDCHLVALITGLWFWLTGLLHFRCFNQNRSKPMQLFSCSCLEDVGLPLEMKLEMQELQCPQNLAQIDLINP